MIGREISHYRVLERLGGGGMGEVFKAEDLRLKRPVALKFLPPELGRDPVAKERFMREARAASALDHPHICTVYDIDEAEDGRLFIAMAFYEGGTLKKRLAAGALSVEEALGIAQQVAEGLAKAHAEGIVHRDVKPANLMITRDGVVKIVDFGLVKLVGDPGLTRTGVSVGTPSYMSPEQAGGTPVDQRTDLWSLGVVLYEMLAGRCPFEGVSAGEVFHGILYDEPPRLGAVRSGVSPEIQRLVGRLLARDPAGRVPRAQDVVEMIRRAREDLLEASEAPTLLHTTSAEPEPRTPGGLRSRRALAGALTGVAALAILATLAWRGIATERPEEESATAPGAGQTGSTVPDRKMIVVLPFKNLGPSEHEYFAAGLTEELTSRLAALAGLGVISRTSATQYDTAGKTMQEIGRDLGVEYVLEGTVRWAPDGDGAVRVRITPQLIRVDDDTHQWVDYYDATLDDIFRVQSDIAGHVVDELEITLLEKERRLLEHRPTESTEAYNAYLRGLFHVELSHAPQHRLLAVERFEEAVSLDPEFALAWARLASARTSVFIGGFDRSDENAARAKRAVERALELDPESPRARLALANYHYEVERDYERALAEYAMVREQLPSSSEARAMMAYVLRRQGRWQEAVTALEEAIALDPRSIRYWAQLANSYRSLRQYRKYLEINHLIESLDPEQQYVYGRGEAWLRMGDPVKAREWFAKCNRGQGCPPELALVDYVEGRFVEALERLEAYSGNDLRYNHGFYVTKELRIGAVRQAMGDEKGARQAYERARELLEPEVEERPGDPIPHSALGLAYAGLGRVEDAIHYGRRGAELLPISKDAVQGPVHLEVLARIYAQVGKVDAALNTVEELLSVPGELSVGVLDLDPVFEALREHPRYARLVEPYRT